jgi:polysaccharide export outer membrane protein
MYFRFVSTLLFVLLIQGCASIFSSLPNSGPDKKQILNLGAPETPIPVLDVSDKLARKLQSAVQADVFSAFQKTRSDHSLQIAAGDSLEVTIWEAPPAVLFGGSIPDAKGQSNGSRSITLPEQMIGKDGFIQVPFAGMVSVAARPLADVEDEIKQRLKGKANQPQVMLRVTKNVTSNATVVGEVKQSLRLPLTAKGEKVMDALAASGGVTQAVGKITLQLSRGGESKQLPMQRLIEDPAQNISLEPGDVVTALYQPLSFTVLGATGKNEEINFEAQGISLAQGLARAGGLQDQRADAQGVFVFRFEEPTLVESTDGKPLKVTAEGKVPVVYRVDMKDPRAFLAAQNFPLRNKDLLYVSNAPAAELQKFLNILTSSIFSVSNLVNLTK